MQKVTGDDFTLLFSFHFILFQKGIVESNWFLKVCMCACLICIFFYTYRKQYYSERMLFKLIVMLHVLMFFFLIDHLILRVFDVSVLIRILHHVVDILCGE
jgi:hypothetical protein